MKEFQMEVLKQIVGHCSHNIGWNGIQASALDLLSEVLQKYVMEMGRSVHIYSEQFGRTEPNLDDLGLTFRDMGITIQDLTDYVCNVEPTCFLEELAYYPLKREHNLEFLKSGSHEVLTRPVHVHEHLPPMHHIALGEEKMPSDIQDNENLAVIVCENIELLPNNALSPRTHPFKRPDGTEKRKGIWLDEGGQPIREISSVMMTTSGYLSSSREGKLPDPSLTKMSSDTDLDSFSLTEKKVSMKKIFEGIKKPEERYDLGKKSIEARKGGLGERKKNSKEHVKEAEKEKLEPVEGKDYNKEKETERHDQFSFKLDPDNGNEREKRHKKDKELETAKAIEHVKVNECDKIKIIEKEKEREKEKDRLKKKRFKEKLLEEFAFFEKQKSVHTKSTESSSTSESAKNKSNTFHKSNKTREQGNSSPHIPDRRHHPEATLSNDKTSDEVNCGGSSKIQSEVSAQPMKPEACTNEKPKVMKKDRKERNKRLRCNFSFEATEAENDVSKRKANIESLNVEPNFLKNDVDQSELGNFGKTSHCKNTNIPISDDATKKKRIRPSAFTPELTEECRGSEVSGAFQTETLVSSNAKSFFPFTSHFSIPGLIPSTFIPNVPFNLIGVPPLGLRTSIGNLPPSATGTGSTHLPSSSVTTVTLPIVESLNKVPLLSSPTSRSPNIVDSLTESANKPIDLVSCGEDSCLGKKKDKRDKKEKEKKKKEKKMKIKEFDEGDKKSKREKKKEKKDKDKDKEKEKEKEKEKVERKDKEENVTVPKITFKFAAAPISPPLSTFESAPKLIFKAIPGREGNFTSPSSGNREVIPQQVATPVEVAKFSALITRPPKIVKAVKKESANNEDSLGTASTSQFTSGIPPRTPSPSPKVRREKPQKPPRITKEKDKEKEKKKAEKTGDVAVITETVGSYYDEFGNKIWICPACGRQDDGTPMIGCDECDDWYHWVCVGIRVPPAETESWFCQRCIAKKQGSLKEKKKARKKKSI